MDVKLTIPNEPVKYSNIFRACRVCECAWCLGESYTGYSILTLCYPCNYKNIRAQCCCFIFDDSWKRMCCVLDFVLYPLLLLAFPILFIFGVVLDLLQLIFGLITCNCCCHPCNIYSCCIIEDSIKHEGKV